MKKKLYVILISIILFACNNVEKTSLSGEILNTNDDLYLLESFAIDNFDTLKIVDGKFFKNIDIDEPKISLLRIGDYFKKVFLMPNHSLEIYYDFEHSLDSISYGGDLVLENNILQALEKELNSLDYMLIYRNTLEKSHSYIDSVETVLNNIYSSFVKEDKVEEIFEKYIKADIKYAMAEFKMAAGYENDLITDSTFNALLDDYFIIDEELLNVPGYSGFITQYIGTKTRVELIEAEGDGGMEAYVKTRINITEEINNNAIRDYLLFDFFKYLLIVENSETSEIVETYLPYFYDNVNTRKYIEYIDGMLEKKKLLEPGKLAPDFTYISLDSTNVSLSDFRGKYVYIDFWATGCGGCRYDLPHLATLKADYEDENIVFLSVSVDHDWEQWSGVIAEESGEAGVHLFTGEDSHSGAFKDYQIRSIPTYVFVDTEGKIVNSRAPRPYSDEVRELFDEYVK